MTKSLARQQSLPFLHRNWITAINNLQSAAVRDNPDDARTKATNGDDEHYLRPAKRRRLAESYPDPAVRPEVDSFVLHEDPVETPRVMQIQVLRITHKDLSRVKPSGMLNGSSTPALKDSVHMMARCKVTITTPGRTPSDTRILYCDSQICKVRTFQNAAGMPRLARVDLPKPFHVPEEKIFVEREDDAVFDFADAYSMTVELESAGDRNWNPLDVVSAGIGDNSSVSPPRVASRHWTLGADIPNMLDRGRRSSALKICKSLASDSETQFVVDVDVRWATALPPKCATRGHDKLRSRSFTHADQEEEHMPLANGNVNGQHVNGNLANGQSIVGEDDVEEDAEGETTPSRSLRARGNKNYNLKVLSAQAQGREPRKRSKQAGSKKTDADRILYSMPREAYPLREVTTDGFSCCICHASHQSLVQLRAHLVSHSQYSFYVSTNTGKQWCQIDISSVPENSDPSLRPKVYQLGKPTKPFDLDRYVEGDDSWAISRLGPNNDDGPAAVLRKTAQPRAVSANIFQKTPVHRRKKKVLVPATKQALFDPLSKSKLVPGTEVRQSGADESWLIQKHRDIVQEFCDVNAAEKEYIKEWDAFIQKRRISSEAFIGRAVVEFITEKIQWLLESKSRTQEFGKHLTVLIARGLDEDVVKIVQSKLQEGRSKKLAVPEKAAASEPPQKSQERNFRGCAVCNKPVRGPTLLVCSNDECKKPLYHEDCVRETAKMPVEHLYWRCNDCTSS